MPLRASLVASVERVAQLLVLLQSRCKMCAPIVDYGELAAPSMEVLTRCSENPPRGRGVFAANCHVGNVATDGTGASKHPGIEFGALAWPTSISGQVPYFLYAIHPALVVDEDKCFSQFEAQRFPWRERLAVW